MTAKYWTEYPICSLFYLMVSTLFFFFFLRMVQITRLYHSYVVTEWLMSFRTGHLRGELSPLKKKKSLASRSNLSYMAKRLWRSGQWAFDSLWILNQQLQSDFSPSKANKRELLSLRNKYTNKAKAESKEHRSASVVKQTLGNSKWKLKF